MRKRFKKIYIEITNICNLNCDFCPKTKRSLKFMNFDIYKKAIEESRNLSDEVTLHIMGEPLLHPKLEEFILFANKMNVRINLTTNGTLISQVSALLLNPTIRRINFSIHSLKSNYPPNKQKEHLQNIIKFTKIAQKTREDLLIIYRLWNSGDESNKGIIKTLEQEFDVILTTSEKKISAKIKNNVYIHFDNLFEWPDPTDEIRTNRGYCHGLSTHIGILCDGTIVPCCLDNNGTISLGNIKDNTIKEVLSFKRAQDMIKGFRERKLVEDMCKKCTYIKRFEKGRDLV